MNNDNIVSIELSTSSLWLQANYFLFLSCVGEGVRETNLGLIEAGVERGWRIARSKSR
jgi:hypothetical protein